MLEKKPFILAVSSLLMILYDSEMTTQMRLAYKVTWTVSGVPKALCWDVPCMRGPWGHHGELQERVIQEAGGCNILNVQQCPLAEPSS